jgi:glycosyltransferase involved in cell wall biosynthesis
MKFANSVICVNEDIVRSVGLSNACVKEAFIPPLDDVDVPLPDDVDLFIRSHDGAVLVCANAYRLTRYEGKDLYGLDQCIELARRLKRAGDDVVIVFVVGTVMSSDEFYWSAEKCIREEGLGDVIKIYPKSLDFLTLMRRADIVLRPTLSDGDALTVREALFFGKPVIASDVVPRPAGTIVYTSESADDLHAKIKGVITQSSHGQEFPHPEAASLDSYRNFNHGVYRKCFN